MEAAAVLRSSSGISRFSIPVVKSGVLRANVPDFVCFDNKFRFANGSLKHCPSITLSKQGQKKSFFARRKSTVVRASSSDNSTGSAAPIAPLQLESPVGQFLSQILKSHPHLVPAAVDQQLEQLQTDRDAEKKEEPSTSGTDLVLYRRIAEVKANERRKALEEILYALVVQKFMDADVSLMPTISPPSASDASTQVGTWPGQEEKLKQLHSPEAYEMIQNHLALILGNRVANSNTVAQISKLRVGQVYAASVMYGYFLKRVDQRFQLEKTMKILPFASDEEKSDIEQSVAEEMRPGGGKASAYAEQTHPEVSSQPGNFSPGGFGHGIKPSRLRTYVMAFDAETLQSYATIRSKEAVTIIEKHTEALFGRPEIVITPQGTIDSSKDELVRISFGGLKRLVLEAVTFGSFLWDVESYVDSSFTPTSRKMKSGHVTGPVEELQLVHSITELKEAGVEFKKRKESGLLDMGFEKGLLDMPRLIVSDNTKPVLLNIAAYEQCHPQRRDFYFTNYINFLDDLMNSPKDVKILHCAGIIDQLLGSYEEVATIVNKLVSEIVHNA